MPLTDFMEFLEPLKLPIRGKEYVIPPMSLETGLRLTAAAEGKEDAAVGDILGLEDVYRAALGSAYDEMVADGVPPAGIERAMMAAWAEYKSGRAQAEIIWETGGDPKAIQTLADQRLAELEASNRATRRKAQKQSPSTAAASTTKRRASTSTTKTSRQNS